MLFPPKLYLQFRFYSHTYISNIWLCSYFQRSETDIKDAFSFGNFQSFKCRSLFLSLFIVIYLCIYINIPNYVITFINPFNPLGGDLLSTYIFSVRTSIFEKQFLCYLIPNFQLNEAKTTLLNWWYSNVKTVRILIFAPRLDAYLQNINSQIKRQNFIFPLI